MAIQKRFPRNIALCLLAVFFFPGLARADIDDQAQVTDRINVSVLEQDLLSRPTIYLKQLMKNPEKRRDYIQNLYVSQRMEAAVVEQGLAQNQPLLEALRVERKRLLIDALVRHEMAKKNIAIETLARERYSANSDAFRIRKKVKLAIIFIKKNVAQAEQADIRIKEILAQLRENPDNDALFHELAKQYSDDKKAQQGGINKRWLIAPVDMEKSDPLVRAAFALDTVGQVTDIVETKQGFAIAKLMAVTPALPVGFDSAKSRIVGSIQSELYNRIKTDVLTSLQAGEDLTINDELVQQRITEAYGDREGASVADE